MLANCLLCRMKYPVNFNDILIDMVCRTINASPRIFAEHCPVRQYIGINPLQFEKPAWANPDGIRRVLPHAGISNTCGEAWLLSALKEGSSIVHVNGKNQNLHDVFENGDFTGGSTRKDFPFMRFPFLVKIFSARRQNPLSLHTHPMWPNLISKFPNAKIEIFMALEDSEMIMGFRSEESMRMVTNHVRRGTFDSLGIDSVDHTFIREHFVSGVLPKGHFYCTYGRPHCLVNGTLMEISDSNNTTYRLTDFGRGREAHLQQFCENVSGDINTSWVSGSFFIQNERNEHNREKLGERAGVIPLLGWRPMDAYSRFPLTGFKPVANYLHSVRLNKGDSFDLGQRAKELTSYSPDFRGLILGFYFVLSGAALFEHSGSLTADSRTLKQGESLLCPPALEKTIISGLSDGTEVLLFEHRIATKFLPSNNGQLWAEIMSGSESPGGASGSAKEEVALPSTLSPAYDTMSVLFLV